MSARCIQHRWRESICCSLRISSECTKVDYCVVLSDVLGYQRKCGATSNIFIGHRLIKYHKAIPTCTCTCFPDINFILFHSDWCCMNVKLFSNTVYMYPHRGRSLYLTGKCQLLAFRKNSADKIAGWIAFNQNTTQNLIF